MRIMVLATSTACHTGGLSTVRTSTACRTVGKVLYIETRTQLRERFQALPAVAVGEVLYIDRVHDFRSCLKYSQPCRGGGRVGEVLFINKNTT